MQDLVVSFEVFLDIVRAAKTQRVPELPQWASARALPQSTPGTPAPRPTSAAAPARRTAAKSTRAATRALAARACAPTPALSYQTLTTTGIV